MQIIHPPLDAIDKDCWSQVARILFDPTPTSADNSYSPSRWTITFQPSEDETDAHRVHITEAFYAWRERWYFPPREAEILRRRYAWDRGRYFRKFRIVDEGVRDEILAQAMRRFFSLERHVLAMIRWEGWEGLWERGRRVVEGLKRGKEGGGDVVVVSIDFEGGKSVKGGIRQFGVAILDTRRAYQGCDGEEHFGIERLVGCRNFITKRGRVGNLDFLFGDSIVLGRSEERWRKTILNCFRALPRDCNVLLISHCMKGTELDTLRQLGIGFEEDLSNVVGLFDTEVASPVVTGRKPEKFKKSLAATMEAFGISVEREKLHCAGNDAFYTLQVLLAMVARDGGMEMERLVRNRLTTLATQRVVPVPRIMVSKVRATAEKFDAECDEWFDSGLFEHSTSSLVQT